MASSKELARIKIFSCHGLGGNQKWDYNNEVGLLYRSGWGLDSTSAKLYRGGPGLARKEINRSILCSFWLFFSESLVCWEVRDLVIYIMVCII